MFVGTFFQSIWNELVMYGVQRFTDFIDSEIRRRLIVFILNRNSRRHFRRSDSSLFCKWVNYASRVCYSYCKGPVRDDVHKREYRRDI